MHQPDHQAESPDPSEARSRLRGKIISALFPLSVIWIVVFDGRLPTALTPAIDSTLYFKLPLEGVEFHWTFDDPEAFLAGELTLQIVNGDEEREIVVFRDGVIREGWRMIGDARADGGFYFGFSTEERFPTAPADSLLITLTTLEDLSGRGPHHRAVLKAGVWEMSGTYSAIYGGWWNPLHLLIRLGQPPAAYLECWDATWPMTVTANEGWSDSQADSSERRRVLGLFAEKGVDGRLCGSHY